VIRNSDRRQSVKSIVAVSREFRRDLADLEARCSVVDLERYESATTHRPVTPPSREDFYRINYRAREERKVAVG